MKAKEIMTPNPDVVTPTDPIMRAAEIMRDREVGFVPVVEDRSSMQLKGVITDRDIAVRHVATGCAQQCEVEQHMTSEGMATVNPDDDTSAVRDVMMRDQIRRVPVTERGRIVGVIAQADVAVKENRPREVG
ncbi:MAG: CBS domain-containing protein [Candidatus Polarisedimenticolia bacterium]